MDALGDGSGGNDGGKGAGADHNQEADIRRFHRAVKERGPKLQEPLGVRGDAMEGFGVQNFTGLSAQGADGHLIAVIGSAWNHVGQDRKENDDDKYNGQGVQIGNKLPLLRRVGKGLGRIGSGIC